MVVQRQVNVKTITMNKKQQAAQRVAFDKVTQRRDSNERLKLWEIYGYEARCCGGHLTHGTYCCPWCGSGDPGRVCDKEGINLDE